MTRSRNGVTLQVIVLFVPLILPTNVSCSSRPSTEDKKARTVCQEQLKLKFLDLSAACLDVRDRGKMQMIISTQGEKHATCPITLARYKVNPNLDLWFDTIETQRQIAIICPKSHMKTRDRPVYLGIDFSGLLAETNALPSWAR